MPTLKQTIAELSEENDHLASLVKAKENSIDYSKRELERARRMFMELYEEKRTLDLRFGWLEEAARDVVTACDDHRNGLIERLADEIGIDLSQEKT